MIFEPYIFYHNQNKTRDLELLGILLIQPVKMFEFTSWDWSFKNLIYFVLCQINLFCVKIVHSERVYPIQLQSVLRFKPQIHFDQKKHFIYILWAIILSVIFDHENKLRGNNNNNNLWFKMGGFALQVNLW